MVLVAALLLAFFLTRSLTHPLHRTLQVLEGLAEGDLTQRLSLRQRDEVGRMAHALDRVIGDVHAAMQADQVKWSQLAEHREEANRVRSMVENAPLAMYFADAQDLIIRYVNPIARENCKRVCNPYLGVPLEMVGQPFLKLQADQESLKKAMKRAEQGVQQELIQAGPEFVDQTVSVVRDTQGRIIGYAMIRQIVTERIKTEQAVAEAAERERKQSATLKAQVDSLLATVQTATQGDLTQPVTVKGDDPIGQMGQGLEHLLGALRSNVVEISHMSETLASAAEEMNAVSQQLSGDTDRTSEDAQAVATTANQVSDRVSTLAAATEELSASIKEIARNTAEAASATTSAVKTSATATETMKRLSERGGEIGEIVKMITSIAEQTNLLALNATIEAARAGESGKGFAVVASEVKELARRTAQATGDIGQKIASIQSDTQMAVEVIGQINQAIDRIDALQTSVAGAVEEQTAVVGDINRNVADASQGSEAIASRIQQVAHTAQSAAHATSDVTQASGELARLATQLQKLTDQWQTGSQSATALLN